jgi:TPR repeat protein
MASGARERGRRLTGLALGALLAGAAAAGPADNTHPQGLEAARAVAKALLGQAEYGAAVEAYREIAARTPGDPRSHYELASTLAFLRDYPEAVLAVEQAIAIDARDPRFHALAGLLYFKLDRDVDAFVASRRGAELGDTTAMFTLVGLYERGQGVAKNPSAALDWARRAADAGHLGAMALLADVYRDGRLGQAADTKRAEAWTRRLREASEQLE